jgi:hypothetical protein
VSIQDLLNVFASPTQSRLQLLINELGIATSGRGDDLNAVLRRASPALGRTRELLAVINAQRGRLESAIHQTDTVLDDLARRRADVREFVAKVATTAGVTADRRGPLRATVRDLPAMLTAARSGLQAIDRATSAGTPFLTGLRRAGPGLSTLTRLLPAFAQDARPALRAARGTAAEGRRIVPSALTVSTDLRKLGVTGGPYVSNLERLMVSTRDQGGFEGVMRIFYSLASLASLYNPVSHVITLFAGLQSQCLVESLKVPGCDHGYSAPQNGRVPVNDPGLAAQQQRILREALALLDRPKAKRSPDGGGGSQPPQTQAASKGATTPPTASPLAPVQSLIDALGGLLAPRKPSPDAGPANRDSTKSLLDFLLK